MYPLPVPSPYAARCSSVPRMVDRSIQRRAIRVPNRDTLWTTHDNTHRDDIQHLGVSRPTCPSLWAGESNASLVMRQQRALLTGLEMIFTVQPHSSQIGVNYRDDARLARPLAAQRRLSSHQAVSWTQC